MMVSLRSFASQHPYLSVKIVVGIAVLAIALLADSASAAGKIFIADD